MFIVEWFYCPDRIIPDSGLTELNNKYIYTQTLQMSEMRHKINFLFNFSIQFFIQFSFS